MRLQISLHGNIKLQQYSAQWLSTSDWRKASEKSTKRLARAVRSCGVQSLCFCELLLTFRIFVAFT